MSLSRRFAGSLALVSFCVFLASQHASAQDPDTAEVQRYVLTEAALAKYTQATKDLAALEFACAADEEEDTEPQSIAEMAALLDATPGAKEAVQSAGMTPREYVVFSLSLVQNGLAAWAASEPGGRLPPSVSQANVDFVTKHDAELEQLATLGSEACDAELAEGDAKE